MKRAGRSFGRGSALACVIALGLALSHATPSRADAVSELVTWMHPAPGDIRSYRLLVARSEDARANPEVIDVGLPRLSDKRGVYGYKIDVPEGATLWVAIQAVDGLGRASDPSAWRRLHGQPPAARLGQPGWPHLVE